ncbi:Arylesterase [Sphingomonas antarctica]|uniref:alpha/beta fold hydrolase n=1 Tax=Sphingomonas antarctica TaxID=2040274 RepID=UPI0039EC4DF2
MTATSGPAELPVYKFRSFDGAELAWREIGEGRPVVLLHGFFSDAQTNWVRYGHAAAVAAKGFRVIMPDLRAHGSSARPHEASAYPLDVLADDGFALLAQLGLSDYDLGGYSLGGRTTVRMLARGARPGKAIVSGMGLSGLTETGKRSAHFKRILDNLGTFEKFTPEWNAEAFLKTTKGDPVALRLLLDSFVDTSEAEIAAIDMPVLVLSGREDQDNGSTTALAELLPRGQLVETPGGHMSAVTKAELGTAMADFLAA